MRSVILTRSVEWRSVFFHAPVNLRELSPVWKIFYKGAWKSYGKEMCIRDRVERQEPTDVGADIVVGSLIKNLGGGLAPTGGYVCGRQDLIDRCAYRLSAPGLGKEVGANLGLLTSFYQGLFLAPTVVASSVKGAIFTAAVSYTHLAAAPDRHP